jgi:Protein of unknown function (DUF3306)
MSEPEDFLARWSRRKVATTEQDQPEQDAAPAVELGAEARASEEKKHHAAGTETHEDAAAPAFDPSTLPPIESIDAGTDVSAFLQSGVPAEMTRAALRRAWAADPAIRDFIGLAENSWDFTAPNAIMGFGPLSAEDASRAMAQLSGKIKEVVERIAAIEPPAANVQTKIPQNEPVVPKQMTIGEQDDLEKKSDKIADALNSVQRNKEDIATQQTEFESNTNTLPTRRSHGSALPE